MKEYMVNLGSMVADSTKALKRLAKDVKELKKLMEIKALRENSRSVSVDPGVLDEIYGDHVRK
jgi:hypothetical protein